MKKLIFLFFLSLMVLSSCYVPPETRKDNEESGKSSANVEENTTVNIKTSKSVKIPADKSMTPVPGEQLFTHPDTVLHVTAIGEEFEVKNGQEVNFIFDENIDPEETYFSYESTYDGYILKLHKRTERIKIDFKRMCQKFIVADPNLTVVNIPEDLRYEQIIWTPRRDGTWEVRIGTTERGCKSKALKELRKMRDENYERNIPK